MPGLLFVDPAALRRGVGAQLHRHVLGEAGRLGSNRVLIEGDPHAVGFHLRMGAVRSDSVSGQGPVPMVAFPSGAAASRYKLPCGHHEASSHTAA